MNRQKWLNNAPSGGVVYRSVTYLGYASLSRKFFTPHLRCKIRAFAPAIALLKGTFRCRKGHEKMENKLKKAYWLYPETEKKISSHLEAANCKSASELVEKAINFYCGYLDTKNDSEYLPIVMLDAIDGMMKLAMQPINRNLFKLAVEVSIASNVAALDAGIAEEDITRLRSKITEIVKRENGAISFETAHRTQNRGRSS